MQRGALYKVNGSITEVVPKNGKKFTLEELQVFVGGFLEIVPHSKPTAYANESGRLNNLPFNLLASIRFNYPLVGDVVVIETVKPK